MKQKAATASLPSTVKEAVEENAMPVGQCCIYYPECATHCCSQCAPWACYCDQCFAEAHSKINLFHIGEVWEVGLLLIAKLYHSYISHILVLRHGRLYKIGDFV